MFSTYVTRPDAVQAIRVTEGNVREVAEYVAEAIADENGVEITHPRGGMIRFRAIDADAPQEVINLPVPGALVRRITPRGVVYTTPPSDMFDDQWAPAAEATDQARGLLVLAGAPAHVVPDGPTDQAALATRLRATQRATDPN